jgi:hypothetical protein
LISVELKDKNQLEPVQAIMRNVSVLSHCSLLRNPLTKPTGVLEHFREEESNSCFSIFLGVSFQTHL